MSSSTPGADTRSAWLLLCVDGVTVNALISALLDGLADLITCWLKYAPHCYVGFNVYSCYGDSCPPFKSDSYYVRTTGLMPLYNDRERRTPLCAQAKTLRYGNLKTKRLPSNFRLFT